MSMDWTALHFLRPHWLWALTALPVLMWAWRVQRQRRSAWRGHVDAHLLPHLLVQGSVRVRAGLAVASIAYVLAVLALAGPSWRQVDQPLWQVQRPLVVVLDLSSRTTASDLPPSRVLQARAKLGQILAARAGSPVALVAYADDAFTVAPLTDDVANIGLFLDDLSPDIMPVDGQRTDRGIAWAARLMTQADVRGGDILVLTDRADAEATAAAAAAHAQGHTVSVLGLGTASGAAYRGGDGVIGRAALDATSLRRLARDGGGRYATLTTDEADIAALALRSPRMAEQGGASSGVGKAWRDEGYWLLVPLMALALLGFRRGAPWSCWVRCGCRWRNPHRPPAWTGGSAATRPNTRAWCTAPTPIGKAITSPLKRRSAASPRRRVGTTSAMRWRSSNGTTTPSPPTIVRCARGRACPMRWRTGPRSMRPASARRPLETTTGSLGSRVRASRAPKDRKARPTQVRMRPTSPRALPLRGRRRRSKQRRHRLDAPLPKHLPHRLPMPPRSPPLMRHNASACARRCRKRRHSAPDRPVGTRPPRRSNPRKRANAGKRSTHG